MSNVLTYILNLKDQMSAGLKKIGAESDAAKGSINDLQKGVNNLKSTLAKIGVGVFLGKTIKEGMEQGMKNVSFEVLFGGEEQAKKMIDDINAYSAKAYGTNAVTNAVQMMAGFDIASDQIMGNLQSIGDIAMGDVAKFNSLSLAFSQMSSTGKLMGQDLLQMINAGFNPLVQMSKTTGKSVAQLKDEMSKGLITSQMVTQAFKDATSEGGQFNGMIDKMSKTAGGQWQKIMSNIQLLMLDIYKVIEPFLIPAFRKMNTILTDYAHLLLAPFKALANVLKSTYNTVMWFVGGVREGRPLFVAFASVVGYLTAMIVAYKAVMLVVTVATKAWAIATGILNGVMALNPVGLIIAGVVALIALIAFLIIKIDGWGDAWKNTIEGVKLIFKAFTESVKLYFNTMINGLMIGLNKIKEGWYNFKEAVGLGDSNENQQMLKQIQDDTNRRKQEVTDGLKNVMDLEKQAAASFKAAANSFSWNDTKLEDVVGGMKAKLGITTDGEAGGLANAGGAGTTGTDTAKNITTGGQQTKNITINMSGDLVGEMTINSNNLREGVNETRTLVGDELLRLLYSAASMA